jgi:3-hydroxybutyryl-CoA dehydrogenase
VGRGKITEEAKAEALARISTTLTLTDVGPTDLVIEAATERETVKTAIFEDLLPHLKPETILTSNTSSISITRLASRTDRPERFMGFHFMNPVPVMQLVELIRGIATDEPTFKACKAVVDRLGKTAATAEDFPAFIVNRILMPMINEAVYTLYEGVGSVESIDQSMKLGANHPMGPLELADFIGLDTCLAIMNVLHDGLADTKYRPCPLLTKYVEAGWLGRKTGVVSMIIAARCRCRHAEGLPNRRDWSFNASVRSRSHAMKSRGLPMRSSHSSGVIGLADDRRLRLVEGCARPRGSANPDAAPARCGWRSGTSGNSSR